MKITASLTAWLIAALVLAAICIVILFLGGCSGAPLTAPHLGPGLGERPRTDRPPPGIPNVRLVSMTHYAGEGFRLACWISDSAGYGRTWDALIGVRCRPNDIMPPDYQAAYSWGRPVGHRIPVRWFQAEQAGWAAWKLTGHWLEFVLPEDMLMGQNRIRALLFICYPGPGGPDYSVAWWGDTADQREPWRVSSSNPMAAAMLALLRAAPPRHQPTIR